MDYYEISTKRSTDFGNREQIYFFGPLVTSAQSIIGTEKHPDTGIMLYYNEGDYSQGSGRIEEAYKGLTKDDIHQPYISHLDFGSSIEGKVVGYNSYLFHIQLRKNFTASQPIKVEFKFKGVVPNNIKGYSLVITIKLISVSSDGQKHFDLIGSLRVAEQP